MSDVLDVGDGVVRLAAQGEQLEAYVARSTDTRIRVHDGELEHLVVADALGVGVRIVADGREGFAYCGTFEPGGLAETVVEARENAAYAEPRDGAGLAEADGCEPVDLDVWHPELSRIPTSRKVALAFELERALTALGGPSLGIESCDYGDVVGEAAVVTTTGLRRTAKASGCHLVTSAMAEGDGSTQRGLGYSLGRAFDDLDVDRAADEAAARARRMVGATKPRSARLTVVLEPRVTAQLIEALAAMLAAEEVLKGRSLFGGRVGERVAAPAVTLVEDPTDPRLWGAVSVDDEGLATRRVPLVEAGVLRGFVHCTATARRARARSTGSAVRSGFRAIPTSACRAVSLAPGPLDAATLLAGIDDGVLVQEVSGLQSGVNPVSGDVSTGAAGLRIRHGEPAEPVREFTMASTVERLLGNVVAVGDDLTMLPMSAAGTTLVIDDVSVSGR